MSKFKKSTQYRFLFLTILLLIFIRPTFFLHEQADNFFSKGYLDQYESLRRVYYSSQYAQKENPGIIPDETLEAFAGGAFLKGMNPILIVHDQPPLGRYLISLSILIFDNANTITLIALFFSSIGILLLGKVIFNNFLLALIPLGIFINEPLFLSKFKYSPLLEPIQLPFIIFTLYFFIKGVTQKHYGRWFILASLMLGFVISIRYFILGFVLLLAMFASFLLQKKKGRKLFFFVTTLPLSLIVLVLSYTKTLQDGYSIFQILGIQKYIFLYHKSAFVLPFSFWDLLLFNKWHTWWGNMTISSDPHWFILWPFTAVLVAISFIFALFRKISLTSAEKILMLWVIMYSLMLSAGYTSTRYFLPLIPFLYILALSFILKFLKHEKITD